MLEAGSLTFARNELSGFDGWYRAERTGDGLVLVRGIFELSD